MESLPVTAIPTVIAAEGQSARDVAPVEAGDLTAFEQALEKEILLIAPENAQTAVDAAALGLTLSVSETTPAADGAQILEAILDSGSVLAAVSAPGATAHADTSDPGVAMRAAVPADATLPANGPGLAGEASGQGRAAADPA